ncbi:hypothetical protein Daud_0766 [Candidatus Desulforudis audaxviator MP104C]|uniref:Uncharacterized protein n=2 Tax=Candidatus Desulforudis TaxID=471826 RepID=B1I2V4_DESAP|nr:hypothetical protein Daud_0766 [Candidatus Desulforudis audaxviator MP104C]
MSADHLAQEIEKLSPNELHRLYRVIVAKLAIPLQEPESFYDDWGDPEVDKTYAKTWQFGVIEHESQKNCLPTIKTGADWT